MERSRLVIELRLEAETKEGLEQAEEALDEMLDYGMLQDLIVGNLTAATIVATSCHSADVEEPGGPLTASRAREGIRRARNLIHDASRNADEFDDRLVEAMNALTALLKADVGGTYALDGAYVLDAGQVAKLSAWAAENRQGGLTAYGRDFDGAMEVAGEVREQASGKESIITSKPGPLANLEEFLADASREKLAEEVRVVHRAMSEVTLNAAKMLERRDEVITLLVSAACDVIPEFNGREAWAKEPINTALLAARLRGEFTNAPTLGELRRRGVAVVNGRLLDDARTIIEVALVKEVEAEWVRTMKVGWGAGLLLSGVPESLADQSVEARRVTDEYREALVRVVALRGTGSRALADAELALAKAARDLHAFLHPNEDEEDDRNDCSACHGSGGGPEAHLYCPICGGTGRTP